MKPVPKWYQPIAVTALVWNLMGCASYVFEALGRAGAASAGEVAYTPRPIWGVAGTAIAVWFGALGSLGLILRQRWALLILTISLLGFVIQAIDLLLVGPATARADGQLVAVQVMLVVVALALVLVARLAIIKQWVA